jgi:hypothetical protein
MLKHIQERITDLVMEDLATAELFDDYDDYAESLLAGFPADQPQHIKNIIELTLDRTRSYLVRSDINQLEEVHYAVFENLANTLIELASDSNIRIGYSNDVNNYTFVCNTGDLLEELEEDPNLFLNTIYDYIYDQSTAYAELTPVTRTQFNALDIVADKCIDLGVIVIYLPKDPIWYSIKQVDCDDTIFIMHSVCLPPSATVYHVKEEANA